MHMTTLTALAEPNRFHMIELLHGGPLTVGEVAEKLKLNLPQASKHLKVLSEAGLAEVKPAANRRIYYLRTQPLDELNSWLEKVCRVQEERVDRFADYLKQLQTITQPTGGTEMAENQWSQDVTDYIAKVDQEWKADICSRIRKIIHECVPGVKEQIKMTTPNYSVNGKMICSYFAAKSWVTLTIFDTKGFDIPEGFFDPSDYPDRVQVKIKKNRELDENAIARVFKQLAAAAN